MLKRFLGKFKAKQIILFVINTVLIILFIVLQIISSSITGSLESQKLADRWSEDNSYAQISVFLSENTTLSVDDIQAVRNSVDSVLETESISTENENARLWLDAYSTEGSVTVNREGKSVDSVVVTAVGGDFFKFQPLELLSGTYFWDSDTTDDLVILDENLAWQLFGSSQVAGLELEIGGRPYYVSGVSRCEDSFAVKTAYGESPRIYMSYSAYERLAGTSSPGSGGGSDVSLSTDSGSPGITVYQALIPNPVKHYGLNTITEIFEGSYSGKVFSIIENSDRYSLSSLFELVKSFGNRSMNQRGISYPYWENAARIVEDYAALFFIISIFLLIFPIISLIVLIVKLWRGKKWRAGDIRDVAERIIEDRRGKQRVINVRKKGNEHKKRDADGIPKAAGKSDVSDEISEIVRTFMDDDK